MASDVGRLPDAEGRHAVEIAVMGNDAGESQTLGAGEVDRVIDWLMLESTIAKSPAGKALIST